MSERSKSDEIKPFANSRMRLLQVSRAGIGKITWLDWLQPAKKQLAASPEFHENLAIVSYFVNPRPGNPGAGESLYVVSNTESRGPSLATKSAILENGRLTKHMKNWLAYTAMSNDWSPDLNDFLPLMPGKPFDREVLRGLVMQTTLAYNQQVLEGIRVSGTEDDPATAQARRNAQATIETIYSMGYWPDVESGTAAQYAE